MDMTYQVMNLDTDESRGSFETLADARGCVFFNRLRRYQIWRETVLVEECDNTTYFMQVGA